MLVEYHKWYSPNLGQDMELKVYGHYGKPFLIFPCSRGRFFDYEGLGMIKAIQPHIDSGKIKLFCVDSVDSQSWYNFSTLPGERNARHEQYDAYIVNEVVPFIRNKVNDPNAKAVTNGTSMGAYHALNFFLKHPDCFDGVLALSGLYSLESDEFGLKSHDIPHVFYNSPLAYFPNNNDEWYLNQYRNSKIVVVVGQGAWEDEAKRDSLALKQIFESKGVPAWVDFWGKDVNHDWSWWFIQMNFFLNAVAW